MPVPELDSEVAAPALARLYNQPSYADPWECVEDYRRVLDYAAGDPDAGRVKVGNALDLPPGRVRGWIDGGMPDCVRALNTAIERGWFDLEYEDVQFRGLNVLVAWIFSGGSISERYRVPYFAVETTPDDPLERAARAANVDLEISREGEGDGGRAAEYRATDFAPVLGRILHLLGAPIGGKNVNADIRLPAYLEGAPEIVRREFVATYLSNRGTRRGEADVLGLREERSRDYLDHLADFFEDVAGASVRRSEYNLTLSLAATTAAEDWPPILPERGGRRDGIAVPA